MLLLCPVLLGTMLHLQPILLGTAFQSCWCLRFLGTRDEQKTEMNNLICRFKLFFFFPTYTTVINTLWFDFIVFYFITMNKCSEI